MEMMNVKAQQAGVTLSVAVEGGFPLIYADERAIRQIIVNLLSNSLRFTQPGGTVTVFARRIPDGRP
jgi:signal transduction histidine kinase